MKLEKVNSIKDLKVGDKVKIREDLKDDIFYDMLNVGKKMMEFKGKIVTIEYIGLIGFSIRESKSYVWSAPMIEGKVVDEIGKIGTVKDLKVLLDDLSDDTEIGGLYYGECIELVAIQTKVLELGKVKLVN